MDPRLSWESMEVAVADMRRRAEGRRFLKRDAQAPAPPGDVTIRLAGSDDLRDVERVAQLDSSQSPAEPILVAEVEGTLIAALPLEGGRPVADPFRHTSEVVHLLELRAAQLNGDGHEPGRQTSPSGARPRAAGAVSAVPGTDGPTSPGSQPHGKTPASRLGEGTPAGDPSRMFNDLLELTAVEVRAHLAKLQAERALALSTGVADIDAYVGALEVEIEATREFCVASAVTEIATLRAELSGAQVG